ncbi:endonuclease/exonuclease/phosphatase family protein [Clostridium sp. 19966]|uniref:endonuclease/exonuclease/phosphatase family protein n=1 Tax=Clostridium sp. 19966 TaxID=2768166 RepID=UPI0028DFEB3A|nr:endonuclease/exonuclease/phosphatase family protein [Clostridium sp. 19966]MDT8715454.1 endonuclease/exonuclease/phosphatase family protein [Clostridium sp. 19966]
MNYLFWNTNSKKVNDILIRIINELKCDIVGLAEYEDDITELLKGLSSIGTNLYESPSIGCRMHVLTKYNPEKVQLSNESNYYTIKMIPHDSLINHIVAFVHLPSNLYNHEDADKFYELTDLRIAIEKSESDFNSHNSVIVGDFNINPFEKPMISAGGLHSILDREIAKKIKRQVLGKEYLMFYNPMWNLFGDIYRPPGTYYYNNSSQINYYWHMFDQVIIRPQLIDNFTNLNIVSEFNGMNLLKNDKPTISDHLPIFFTIE